MTESPPRRAARLAGPYLRGYAAVLFCSHPLAGLLILAVTFIRPEVGATGLLAALSARAASVQLGYAEAEQPPEIYNALLVGLAIGSVWAFSPLVAGLAIAAGAITALATHVLSGWLWRLNRLPAMSLAFVLIAWLFAAISGDVAFLEPAQPVLYPDLAPVWLSHFFTSLGWFLFTPHPVAGVAMFVALLISSRYLALLAVAGYAAGALTLTALGSAVLPSLTGFNFMLAAMAVGGLFAFPGRASFGWGLFASVVAALFCVALQGLSRFGLPPLAAPFLLASWLVMAGLSLRPGGGAPFLLLDNPTLPERSLIAARLARARLAEPGSYAVNVPFFGDWQVSQGIDGPHTHRGPWRHAFDFIVVDERGRSYRNDGGALDDYLGFGAPVLAPVAGQVWRCEDRLPDNRPGEIDARAGRNFGNHVLLRTADAAFVLLAHLKQGSLRVKPGDWIEAGQVLAACGNSGRSAQPHLHLQVQVLDDPGAPTRPLHLRSIVQKRDGVAGFSLSARPAEGDIVGGALRDRAFAEAMHLSPGHTLDFQGDDGTLCTLRVELTLLGQFRLVGGGASAALDECVDVLAFYDRAGAADPLLDSWMLALGLTPFSDAAKRWRDAPPAILAPLSIVQRALLVVLRPFGASFDSSYERSRDESGQGWRQTGRHRLRLAPGLSLDVATETYIDAVHGCRELTVTNGPRRRHFTLVETGVVGDIGVPARQKAV